MSNPIGACQAVIKSVKTTSDGSFDVTLSINCDETDIIERLVRLFGQNEKLINVGFATHDG